MKSKVDKVKKFYPKSQNKDSLKKKKKIEEEVSVGLRGHKHRLVVARHRSSHCYKHGIIWKLSKLKHAMVKQYNINMTEVAILIFIFIF